MSKRTIGDFWNKERLPPCDHAWAMRSAYFDERDRLLAKGKRKAANAADALGVEWLCTWDRLVRERHGARDISPDAYLSDDTVWVGTSASGDKVIYRYLPGLEGNASYVIAEYFLRRLALENARAGLQGYALAGNSTVTFNLARKREAKVGGRYVLEDTGYTETQWEFGAKWRVEVTVETPKLVGESLRRQRDAIAAEAP